MPGEHELRIALATALKERDTEKAARWELEKERGEVNAALKAEMAEAQRLRIALERCSELFSAIRGDWTDPRSECREGQDVIRAALATGGRDGT